MTTNIKRVGWVPLLLCMMLSAGLVWGQAASTNYKLTAGYVVGGGGSSSSLSASYAGAAMDTVTLGARTLKVAYSAYQVVGNVPLTGAGKATSTDYTMNGGVIGAIFGAATGGTGAVTGTFYHRTGGQVNYASNAMLAGAGDTLTITVGLDMLGGLRGMEYYFKIDRGGMTTYVGTEAEPYVFRTQLTDAQAQSPAMPSAQYRIIGLPIIPTNSGLSNVFADNLGTPDPIQWRLGRYIASADSVVPYPNSGTVNPGRAYWLIARGGKTYGSAGVTVYPNRLWSDNLYYEVALDTGWNQLANPYAFSVNWGSAMLDDNGNVTGHDPSILDNVLYSYNGTAYTTITTIPAWSGVFVHIKKPNVKVLFPYIAATQPAAPQSLKQFAASPTPDSWNINLTLVAGGLVDDGNLAGVRSDAFDGEDNYDFAEPPPPPNGPSLAFRLNDYTKARKRIDYRAPFSDGATWDIIMSRSNGRQLQVTGIANIPDGMQARLVFDDGTTADLTEGMVIAVPDNAKTAQLVIGTEEYLAGRVAPVPNQYFLDQNNPNPFNPATTIRFGLPKAGKVRLDIVNILGQTVKTLVDRDLNAGYHAIVWKGDDGDGHGVASGIYFYRLRAGDFTQSRKMVLLK